MNDKDEKAAKRKRTLRVFSIALGLFFVVPLLICGGVATWFFGRQSAATTELDARLDDLTQQGEPIDNDGLQRLHKASTSDRRIELWTDLRTTIESPDFTMSTLNVPYHGGSTEGDDPIVVPAPGANWPNRATADDFLRQWQAELASIHELAHQELDAGQPLRRPIEFKSIMTLLPETTNLRAIAKLLRLQHAVATYDGDRELAISCIRACLGLERSTRGEPSIISQMTGLSIGMLANQMLQKSLEHDQLNDEQIDAITEVMPTFDQLYQRYTLAIRGERAMVLPVFLDHQLANEVMELNSPAGAKLLVKLRAKDAMYYLDQIDSYLAVPGDDLNRFYKEAQGAARQLKADVHNSSSITNMDRMFAYTLLPPVGPLSKLITQREESNRLAKLAMAVRRFQHEYDRWPKSIDELNLDADLGSLKPVGILPFGYRVEEDGDAVLWGINRSIDDDIPTAPPKFKNEDSPNAMWVWRLRP